MTRQQNKPYIVISIIQIIMIVVGLVFNYFSLKKMGLMRHLIFRNYTFDKLNIKIFLWLILAALIFSYILYRSRNRGRFNSEDIFSLILFIVIGLMFNQVIGRFKYDYYYQSFLFIFIAVLQMIKLSFNLKKSV